MAVLAAYKDISPPWKELLKFYQISEDVKVKYAQIIEQFAPHGMTEPALLEAGSQRPQPLTGTIRASRLRYVEEGATQVDDFDFSLGDDRHSAILSQDGSASDEPHAAVGAPARPQVPGSIQVGDADLQHLPEAVTGQRIGYCSAASRLFNASIRDNLYYGLKHQPQTETETTTAMESNERRRVIKEALASGNSIQDSEAEWLDIRLAGAADQTEFTRIVHAIIECVELDDDLLTLALRTTEAIDIPAELAERIVTLRDQLIDRINSVESGAVVEPLDAGKYIHNLTVEENLLFGSPTDGSSAAEFLAANPLAGEILQRTGLRQALGEIGLTLAGLMVELFSDVPDDSELFDQFSFIQAADLPEYRQLLAEVGSEGTAALSAEQRAKLLAVSFQLCPARHRLELITPPLQEKVVAARSEMMEALGTDGAQVRFYDRGRYNRGMSVQENLLFGKIAYAKGHLQPRVTEIIKDTLKHTGLHDKIVLAGLNCPAGAGGSKLSAVVRQKLTLARALLKNPDILIINNALSELDGKRFARILDRIIELRRGRNLIWALNDPALLPKFDRVLIAEQNKLLHDDSAEALSAVIEELSR